MIDPFHHIHQQMKAVLALLLGLITCTLILSHATHPTEPHTIDPLHDHAIPHKTSSNKHSYGSSFHNIPENNKTNTAQDLTHPRNVSSNLSMEYNPSSGSYGYSVTTTYSSHLCNGINGEYGLPALLCYTFSDGYRRSPHLFNGINGENRTFLPFFNIFVNEHTALLHLFNHFNGLHGENGVSSSSSILYVTNSQNGSSSAIFNVVNGEHDALPLIFDYKTRENMPPPPIFHGESGGKYGSTQR
eukprot:505918_1